MIALLAEPGLDFELPSALEAREPAEVRGSGRDDVRLLVGRIGTGEVEHHRFADLPDLLAPGDLVVVNTTGTLPAALDTDDGLTVHLSTEQADGRWVVELRQGAAASSHPTEPAASSHPTEPLLQPYAGGLPGDVLALPGAAKVWLEAPYTRGRLWLAHLDVPDVRTYLARYGRPIRYGYVRDTWPIEAYQTVFATEPGSAEMPSAGRPFTAATVVRLVTRGVGVAPITLHTGVASPEAHEKPYPEWFRVPEATARLVAATRAAGGRVVAVGTTVVRALESATDAYGRITAREGWTDLVVTPERGVRAVDGLLTGLHEPRASHLLMLEAVAGRYVLRRCYAEALAQGYLWHEFGDVNLLVP